MLIVLMLIIPIITGIFQSLIKHEKNKNLFVICLNFVLVALSIFAVFQDDISIALLKFNNLSMTFLIDDLAKIFILLICFTTFVVSIYLTYFYKKDKSKTKFLTFFELTIATLLALSMSNNMFTFYIFFELMTIVTMFLVAHNKDERAVQASLKYFAYSVFGAILVLTGIFILLNNGYSIDFAKQNMEYSNTLLLAYSLIVVGFGAKTGMFPLHILGPTYAPVSPSPANAILSGLITKMGLLGVIRVTFYVFDIEMLSGTIVQKIFIVLALITIFSGSMLAFKEKNLKKRLAYSTMSQISYALVAIFMFTSFGLVAAILQIIFHSLAKHILFLSAGTIIKETGEHNVTSYNGLGKSLPLTFIAFTIASLSLIGIPLTGGFIAKWHIATSTIDYNIGIFIVLIVSAILTAHYLLTIVIRAFFKENEKFTNIKENKLIALVVLVLAVFVVYLSIDTSYIELLNIVSNTLV